MRDRRRPGAALAVAIAVIVTIVLGGTAASASSTRRSAAPDEVVGTLAPDDGDDPADTVPADTEPEGTAPEDTEPDETTPEGSTSDEDDPDDGLVGAGDIDDDIDPLYTAIALIGFVALLAVASWWMVRRDDPDAAPMPPDRDRDPPTGGLI